MNEEEVLNEVLEMIKTMKDNDYFGPFILIPSPLILKEVTIEELQAYFECGEK